MSMFLEHFPDEKNQHGWIEVVCGSMFSGKTEELIRRLKRAEFAKQKILLVKPTVDDRYHKENVVSHQGTSFEAISVKDSKAVATKVLPRNKSAIEKSILPVTL